MTTSSQTVAEAFIRRDAVGLREVVVAGVEEFDDEEGTTRHEIEWCRTHHLPRTFSLVRLLGVDDPRNCVTSRVSTTPPGHL